ncbi:hypothetical protein [Nocardia caishijiensis]|uniref:Membrane protein n=1 Tax=Nocardia caishijiensis TaxID=184756 RepID=A0ABQ6YT77_9NOCA|nr:hypothetical protein [Nocardia caishijiensis]KAF0848681.1 putative membrane protein [Nocardia caishijiensis]
MSASQESESGGGEYRPRHAKPERPEVSYSLSDEPVEPSHGAHEARYPGRPEVSYGGLPVGDTDAEAEAPEGKTWSTVAFVFAVIALLFFPIIFGVLGIAAGLYGNKKGEPLGNWSAVAALFALLAGLAIRVFFFDADIIPSQN